MAPGEVIDNMERLIAQLGKRITELEAELVECKKISQKKEITSCIECPRRQYLKNKLFQYDPRMGG